MFRGNFFTIAEIKEKLSIKRIILEHGGNVAFTITTKTTHVITTYEEFDKRSSLILKALKLGLPILDQSYITESDSQGTKVKEDDYLCKSTEKENTPANATVTTTTAHGVDAEKSGVLFTSHNSANNMLKEIRVFLSSTIVDMHKEREFLLKRIFPEIRSLCTERGVAFSWVDLRWGITEQQKNEGRVIELCLSEVDRCNIFVCMLGERYGWSQSIDHPDPVLQKTIDFSSAKFPWTKNFTDRSVTELEIRQATEYSQNKNSIRLIFLFRDNNSNWITSAPSEEKATYQSDGEVQLKKLHSLKDHIRAHKYPLIENYQSPQQFGQSVLENLRAIIEMDCPVVKSVLQDPMENEKLKQNLFMLSKTHLYIKKNKLFEELSQYAFSDSATLPLVVLGTSGVGKSSLLSSWNVEVRSTIAKDYIIIPFFVHVGNYNAPEIARWMITAIKDAFDIILPLPDLKYAVRDLPYWIQLASEKGKVLVILDGIHKIIDRNLSPDIKEEGSYADWMWLPTVFPENFRIIISTVPGPQYTKVVAARKFHRVINMPWMVTEEKKQFVVRYLARFGKTMSNSQLESTITCPRTDHPLFLRALVDSLHSCKFETIDKTLSSYLSAPNISGLYGMVIQQWEKDFNTPQNPKLVPQALSYLITSRKGLTETDLFGVLQLEPQHIYDWQVFYVSALRENLFNKNGQFYFFHDQLATAVRSHYLSRKNEQRELHVKLAQYFGQIELNRSKLEEYPYHLEHSNQKQELKEFLSDFDNFYFLHSGGEELKNDLFHYWYNVLEEKNENIGAIYFKLATDFAATNPPGDILGDRLRVVAEFFSKIGQYDYAVRILRTVIYTDENLFGQWHEIVAHDLYLIAFNFYHQADYEEAFSRGQRAFEMTKSAKGADHVNTSECLTLLGLIFKKQGEYDKALPYYTEALDIIEKNFGENHSLMGENLSNLGDLSRKSGAFDKSLEYYNRAMKVIVSILGNQSFEYANLQNLVGLVHKKKGEYDQAEKCYEMAISITKQSLGSDHPKCSEFAYNLADVYRKRDKFDEAMKLYEESMTIVKKVYGDFHPELAEILNDIGLVKKKQGHYDDAIKVYQDALVIIQKTFGRVHFKAGMYLTNIADVYRKQAKYAQAEETYKEATEILEQTLGPNHYEVAEALNSRALVLKKKTFYDEAEPLYRRALDIIEQTFGTNHPKYGLYLNNLADLERKRGKLHEAYRIYSRALQIIASTLGEEHSEAADITNNMGLIKIGLEYPHDALEMFIRALKIIVKEFGFMHPKAGMYLNNIGEGFYAIKRYDVCETCYFESLVILFKTLGQEHVEVADVFANYAILLVTLGISTWPKALGLYTKATQIIQNTFGKEHPKVIKWSKAIKDLEQKNVSINEKELQLLIKKISAKDITTVDDLPEMIFK